MWLKCLQDIEDGKIKRLMGLMPPGSGKSIYTSVVFPAHYLGRFARKQIILASYGSDLPKKLGRRARSIIQQPIYQRIFDTQLSEESAAADEWALTNQSEWMAGGILTGITGNRADGIIWDDLIKGRAEADSDTIRNKTWDEYIESLLSRKKPNAWEVGITCMVGGTLVLMADGTQKELKNVRPGDPVATYFDGKVITSKVLNWANKGPDNVFTIKTRSGTTVTANSRHPFLIEREGKLEWVRLKNISVGHRVLKVIGANGGVLNVRSVRSLPGRGGSVTNIMENGDGKKVFDLRHTIIDPFVTTICDTAMALVLPIMRICFESRGTFVQFADAPLDPATLLPGRENFASIIAMIPERCVASYAMPATSWSEREPQRKCSSQQFNTYGIIYDEIISIEPAGREDVFDVQIENTENFIANGLISHNTRWHEDDIAGRILPEDYNGESGLIKCRDGCTWMVVCLPAEAEREDDILGRKMGERLWPEWFTEDHFRPVKLNPRTWSALYQQRPAPDTGAFFEKDWFKPYTLIPHRETMSVYGASDYAVSQDKGDFTVHVVVGIDDSHRMYLLDLWRKQAKADQTIEAFCNLVEKWRPMGWAEETGQIKAALGPFIEKRLRERRLYIPRVYFPTRGEGKKEIRAQSIAGRMAMSGLWVPMMEPWYAAFQKEMLTFPFGRHDDQADAMSLIGQILDKMVQGSPLRLPSLKSKLISTDPSQCTVTLDDLFDSNEAYSLDDDPPGRILRIN